MSYFAANADGSDTDWGTRRYTGFDGLPEVFAPGAVYSDTKLPIPANTPVLRQTAASTPMVMDILAIQARYGADLTTRTGNDIYGFDSAIPGRPMYNFDTNPNPVFSIYDAGGLTP